MEIIDEIYSKIMELWLYKNRDAEVIVLGIKTYNDMRSNPEIFSGRIYRPSMGLYEDDAIFGVRVIISNKLEEISVI